MYGRPRFNFTLHKPKKKKSGSKIGILTAHVVTAHSDWVQRRAMSTWQ